MAILDRINRLIRANINELISRAEDPEKIINQALADMKNALVEARVEVASALAETKKLERERRSYLEQATAWQEQAAKTLSTGREDLAREALKRKQQVEALAEGFVEQISSQQQVVEKLKTQVRALDAKLQEAESKRRLLLARKKRVDAAESVRRVNSRLDGGSAAQAFDEMEERILTAEDRHEALRELEEDLDFDKELAVLEQDSAIDEALQQLKKELAQT